jgi:CHAT domain-containing protein/tetratricopeptide (TPR) repeat protein
MTASMKLRATSQLLFLFLITTKIFGQSPTFTIKDTAFANQLLKESGSLNAKVKFTEGYAKADSALIIFEQALGKETAKVAEALMQKGAAYRGLNKFEEAILFHERSLNIRQKVFGKEHALVAQSCSYLGTLHRLKGNYPKFLEYILLATKIREKILPQSDPNILRSYNNLADAYLSNDDFIHALEYNQKAVDVLLEFQPKNLNYLAKQYGNIALVYNTIGQYNKADNYFQKTLSIQRKIYAQDTIDMVSTYINMGVLYNYLGDYDKAIDYLHKALNIQLKQKDNIKEDIEATFRNLGMSYLSKGDYDKSINYFRQGIDALVKAKGSEFPDISDFYGNIGVAFFKNKQVDSAIYYLKYAIDLQSKIDPNRNLETAKYYVNLGLCYDNQKNYAQALDILIKSLNINEQYYGVKSSNLIANIQAISTVYFHQKEYKKALYYLDKTLELGHYLKKNDFSAVDNKMELTQTLRLLSQIYLELFDNSRDIKHLEQETDYAEQAVNSLNNCEEALKTEGSKSLLKNTNYAVYESAIEANYRLSAFKNKDSLAHIAFQYTEQSKAKFLQSQIQTAYALAYAGIPDSLLQEEASLRQSIVYYEKQRQEKFNVGKSETDSSVLAVSSTLFETQKQYDSLKTALSTNYPDYYRLKYNLKTLDIATIQKTILSNNQTLLEYFVGDSSIFVFTINKDNYKFTKIPLDFNLDSLVRLMRDGIVAKYDLNKSDDERADAPTHYTEGASKLYDKLIRPFKKDLKKELIIVPDGILGTIPFEALISEKDETPYYFNAHKYLIDAHQVSYAYSATLLKDVLTKKHKQEPTNLLLAMAPFSTADTTLMPDLFVYQNIAYGDTSAKRSDIVPLKFSGQEVANITKLMNGTASYGKDATESKFMKIAANYRIIHLATHSQINDKSSDYSFLAFNEIKDSIENELLFVRELYNLSLNADLVVLSACETGVGNVQKGEGIISLARAFTYAGAKSIVTTLWQVNDQKSKILMIDFYKHLKRGLPKREALWRAKHDFIRKTNGDPYFWAGYIGIGNMNPIKVN